MTQALKRFYDDSLSTNKELPKEWKTQYMQQMHTLFVKWVQDNNLDRDFASAARQAASMVLIQYLSDGKPSFAGDEAPGYEQVSRQAYKPMSPQLPPAKRYYDETSSINTDIDDSKFQPVMAVAFVQWIMQGWHARDFIQATSDFCEELIYDYHLCCSLGGLGGGKNREAFLTTDYA